MYRRSKNEIESIHGVLVLMACANTDGFEQVRQIDARRYATVHKTYIYKTCHAIMSQYL